MTQRLGLCALLFIAALAGCDDDDDTTNPANEARLRAVHASPDAPAVDIAVDGAIVVPNVPYGTASDYLVVPSGARDVEVRATGTTTPVIDAPVTLADGVDYTMLAIGLLDDITSLVLTDDNSAPPSGNARVRVVHAAPSAPPVDIYVTALGADLETATPTLSALAFGAASSYVTVPAGDYQVRVTLAGFKAVALDAGTATLADGQVRTVVAIDAPGGGPPFDALLLEDRN